MEEFAIFTFPLSKQLFTLNLDYYDIESKTFKKKND